MIEHIKTWAASICFVLGLLWLDAYLDGHHQQKVEQARLAGVTEGAKAVSLKCGTVSGYINTGAVK